MGDQAQGDGYNHPIEYQISLNYRGYLLGLCSAFICQPLEDMISFTSKMSTTLDPNATIVISGLPMINNSGISLILQTLTCQSEVNDLGLEREELDNLNKQIPFLYSP